ncbi:MAG: hypothetical protein D8M52_04990 [Chlorobi bacterium]|nr:MAG: cell wall-active antibiotics response protein [Bacteroidota bacterium]MBE2266307.1 hypothetical protein [Flavobacteriales bacterium]MBL1161057.1 hypothetical protein [Chlorobiota bacterium]MBW7854286.1 hypothetical protein [Candidatus Kapabacteria bacterium]MCC6331001.1 hypothetical protein [Ignavibacteria bacterium]
MDNPNTSAQHSVHFRFGTRSSEFGLGFWLGIILVLVGTGWLLNSLGLNFYGDVILRWWPVSLSVLAILRLIFRSGTIVGNVILFSVGAILQMSELGYLPGGFWSAFWPVLLILIGISFITKRIKKKGDLSTEPLNGTRNSQTDSDTLDTVALFSSFRARSTSQQFTGGDLTAVFGSVDCDLRLAGLRNASETITATAVLGGITIRVPSTWTVIVRGTPILGSIDDTNVINSSSADAPVLFINATSVLAEIEITS